MVQACTSFASTLVQDIVSLAQGKGSEEEQNKKIASVALRIIGTLGLLASAGYLYSAITAMRTGYALLGLVGLIASHDAIVMGNNESPAVKGKSWGVGSLWGSGKEAWTGVPRQFHGTILAAPIFRAMSDPGEVE